MLESKLKEIYSLYESGEYEKAIKINNEILLEDPDNIYAKRYVSLLSSKNNSNNSVEKSNIPKVKGKQLKCPACLSKISFTALSEDRQKAIKSGNYNNLEIKCPYCHKNFVLQKRTAKSILGLKIGEKIELKGKEYRITGYVEYSGRWREYNYGALDSSGKLNYLEWILLGKDNSYVYFSESVSYYEGDREEEFEISEKYTPKGEVKPDYAKKMVQIDNGRKKYFKEIDSIKVKSVYGENSKSYTIGETVTIYDAGDFVIEKEGAGSQLEVGIYKGKKLSKREAATLFNKKISEVDLFKSNKIIGLTGWKKIFFVIYLGIIAGIISFIVLPPFLSSTTEIKVGNNYYLGGEYKNYNGTTTCSDDESSWTCYSYTKTKGLAFSLKNKEDVDLYNKLKNSNVIDKKLKQIVSGKLYEYSGDYTGINNIKSLWILFIGFIIGGLFILFYKGED